MSSHIRRSFFAAVCTSLFAVACSHPRATVPPATPAAPATPEQPVSITTTTSAVVPPPAQASIRPSAEILKVCSIDFGNIDKAPKFDFDKSELRPEQGKVLEQIAECVTTGPLKGRSLQLVGRCDPRGEVEYNFVLGEERASSVRTYLTQLGVEGSKLSATSRGELDATGTDESGWQRDRRVDIDVR